MIELFQPLTIDHDERNKITFRCVTAHQFTITHEFKMDTGAWIVKSVLTFDRADALTFAKLIKDKASQMPKGDLKRK